MPGRSCRTLLWLTSLLLLTGVARLNVGLTGFCLKFLQVSGRIWAFAVFDITLILHFS